VEYVNTTGRNHVNNTDYGNESGGLSMKDRNKYWVWLSSLVKISPRKRYELLEHFKDPANIWYSSIKELKTLEFLDRCIIDKLIDMQARKETDFYLEKMLKSGIEVVTICDKKYPELLKHIYDPPAVIYVKGELVESEDLLAVVGSRRATAYGLNMAESLAYELSGNGLTIVSGMARGIDSRAHNGALKAGGRTIAVLGCGLDIIYPSENKELMKRICDNGAVISEYLQDIPPIPFNFPARNRIISGISKGVAVIEANEKSGSLITANFALEQGRDVFAVPGNINSSNSAGTNRLIRDGAKIVLDVKDILDELKLGNGDNNTSYKVLKKISYGNFNYDEKAIIGKLIEQTLHIDTIARECGFSVQKVGSILIMLELGGFIEQLPGKFYKLID
jgi:DNA processing protein